MKMSQIYDVWEIEPGRDVRVSVEALIDDWEGFRVLVKDHGTQRIVRIAFDSHVAYLNRDESDLDREAARSSGLGRGCFYRVRESEFASRFQANSARQFSHLNHFAIVTDIDCIDILATGEPRVERL
jgi:hypothetical protein